METMMFVVFCSPAGSTRHVAGVIEKELRRLQAEIFSLDLGRERDWSQALASIKAAGKNACLFIGSPVYRNLTVPPVKKFIEALPDVQKSCAIPFVTWGGAVSGIALWEMGKALCDKGFIIAGAAKVLSVHSLMWYSDNPMGSGHPDTNDDKAVEELVRMVFNGLSRKRLPSLQLEALDYQPLVLGEKMKKNLLKSWPVTPKKINETKCSECDICRQECPAGAITMEPYPKINAQCFDCFNCVRLCPENAIESEVDPQSFGDLIKKRAEMLNEQPLTQVFIGC